MTEIELLDSGDFTVLKVIQIVGTDRNPFKGNFIYVRDYEPDLYESNTIDLLDIGILEGIKKIFPNSFFNLSKEIIVKGQMDQILQRLEGGTRKNITIIFYPLIPPEETSSLVGTTFKAAPIKFDLRLLFNEDSEKKQSIVEFINCYIPYDKIKDLVKTIKPI